MLTIPGEEDIYDAVPDTPLKPEPRRQGWAALIISFSVSGFMTVSVMNNFGTSLIFILLSCWHTSSQCYFSYLCLADIWLKSGFGHSHQVSHMLAKVSNSFQNITDVGH